MNIKWDANKYTTDFSFVHQYGNYLIELISNCDHENILDLGCGNGALTNVLHEKGYSVIGMDSSSELLEIARRNYPGIEFFNGDATNFVIDKSVDIVFSNAVLHWIDKKYQPNMMKCVYNALSKHGKFIFELGGIGNNKQIHDTLSDIFSEHGYCYNTSFYFPSISEYSLLLEKYGFRVNYAILFDRLTELSGTDGLEDWIYMFLKSPFSIITSDEEKEEIIKKTVSRLKNSLYFDGKWHADYVRLRMRAERL